MGGPDGRIYRAVDREKKKNVFAMYGEKYAALLYEEN